MECHWAMSLWPMAVSVRAERQNGLSEGSMADVSRHISFRDTVCKRL
eukprot:jgi/Antlo1/457/1754